MKQRIDAEHDDYVARIRELEEHIEILEEELVRLGAQPADLSLRDGELP